MYWQDPFPVRTLDGCYMGLPALFNTRLTWVLAQCRDVYRRRQWHPTPVLLPGNYHGWRSLVGCSSWGHWVRQDWAISLSLFTFMHWGRKWQPTPVFLPGESQGWRSPNGLPSVGSHRVGHDWSDLAAAAAEMYMLLLLFTVSISFNDCTLKLSQINYWILNIETAYLCVTSSFFC